MFSTLNLTGVSEVVELSSIIPYQNNAKVHTPQQIEELKKSIQASGYYQEIVIDEESTILLGHGRLEAIKQLGFVKVGVRRIKDLTSVQKKEMRLNDNLLNSMTGYNLQLLKLEMNEIKELGGNIELLGLNEALLETIEAENLEKIDITEETINPTEIEK